MRCEQLRIDQQILILCPGTSLGQSKHASHRLNEYAGIYKYRILTEYLSLHSGSVSEGFFPERIDLGLVIKETAQKQNLKQAGCDEKYQVEC